MGDWTRKKLVKEIRGMINPEQSEDNKLMNLLALLGQQSQPVSPVMPNKMSVKPVEPNLENISESVSSPAEKYRFVRRSKK